MGNQNSPQRINYEDIQYAIKNTEIYMMINTMPSNLQNCLICNTTPIDKEEHLINNFIKTGNYNIKIIIYGQNASDETVTNKATQLYKLGFVNLYVYLGGIFEWLMLQDIYGSEDFQTTSKELDILKYKSPKQLDIRYISF